MGDFANWNLNIGQWRGVQVRVHVLFVAVAVFFWSWCTASPGQGALLAVVGVTVLFCSVLVHELGHCFAVVRLGGQVEEILLGPFGGLATADVPREPQSALVVALAGPLVNLGIVLLLLPLLIVGDLGVPDPLGTLDRQVFLQNTWWAAAIQFGFWINWLLFVVNLLPAFPFDGARVLRAALWPAVRARTATLVTVRASKLTAVILCLAAALLPRDAQGGDMLPVWVPLVLLALFVYFQSAQEALRLEEREWDDDALSYDFSQGYTSLERTVDPARRDHGSLRRWLHNRREMRRRRRAGREQDEERQVDEILMRLHETGIENLTSKERALLERVSARYRNRQRS